MIFRFSSGLVFCLTVCLLVSCSSGSKTEKSLARKTPDPCHIRTNPPLVIPPDFYLPEPGKTTPATAAKTKPASSLPKAEQNFLKKTENPKPAAKPAASGKKTTDDAFLDKIGK